MVVSHIIYCTHNCLGNPNDAEMIKMKCSEGFKEWSENWLQKLKDVKKQDNIKPGLCACCYSQMLTD